MRKEFSNRDYVIHVGACDAFEETDEVVLWVSSPKDDKLEGVDITSAKEENALRLEIMLLDLVCHPILFGV